MSVNVSAGLLRHPVTIERYTETQNDFGEVVEEWATLLTTRADIKPIRGKEYFESKSVNAEVTHRVLVRYQMELKPTDRILFGSRIFNIESAINREEQNVLYELICTETL